jgi:predicted kinase
VPLVTIHFVFGRVGAGKTTYARTLGGVFFCLDEWMANLFTMDAPQPLTLEWMMPRVLRAERQIWAVAQQVVAAGVDVVMELGFFTREQRDRARGLAPNARIHFVDAPAEVRRDRVRARNRAGATIEVDDATFDWAERYFEPLGDDELAGAVIVAT